jgi:transglutaminase-like putative cysteine protease
MFITAPRIRSPFFGILGSQGTSQVGFSDQVSLGGVSEIQKNNRLAFRAEMAKRPLTPYWRGVVMDSFDGKTWVSTPNPMRSNHVYSINNLVKQEIYLEPGRRRYLFALDIPVSVLKVDAQISGNGVIVYNGRNDGRRLQYAAVSAPSNTLTIANANFRRRRYLELPPDFIPKLRDEVIRITEGLDQSEKITAILNYLSPPNYEYSLTEISDVPNALEHFMFVNKKGNCEFFASAMGVMLRMAGIPSRLVGGYKGGMYNEAGGYYAVFEESAHVWVELWDQKNTSWIRYDPTPYSDSVGWSLDDYGFFEAYLDLLDYQWTKFVLNYNLEIQVEVMQSIKEIISKPSISDFDEFFEHLPLVFGVAVLIIALVYFAGKVTTKDKSKALVHNFIRIMKRKGFNKHKSEGLQEFSDRLPINERIKVMPFVERFEDYYYNEKEFDEKTVKFLKETLMTLKK